MSNKIPIDDLFREVLSGGKEQLNLGAWANMDRMLNGQNPYASDETASKRKRRILPFLAIFLLLSTAMTAGLLLLNKKDNIAQDLSQSNAKPIINKVSPTNTIGSNLKQNPTLSESQQNIAQIEDQTNASIITDNNSKNNGNVAIRLNIRNKSKKVSNDLANGPNPGSAENENILETNNITPLKEKNKNNTEFSVAKNDKLSKNKMSANKLTKIEKTEKIVFDEKVTKNRDGSINNISYDTIDKSTIETAINISQNETIADNTLNNKNYKYHPRYLIDIVEIEENPIALNTNLKNEPKVVNTPPKASVVSDEKNKTKRKEGSSMLNAMAAFAGLAINKIGETSGDFFRMFKVLDPGISLGVNAALFNTKHNYGGFHGGLTNHTAISETFSIFTELKFFIRNNSGFTINDIKTQLLNKSVDNSVPGQTSYSYQVDSLTKKYNFKSFMSLELPLMLSARFNNLSIYGGPNFVYNFKLKINEIDKKYVTDRTDVVSNGTQYNYPDEKGMKYTRNDFGSRFGIGYAVGVSYNFNPKIYLDLRMSKVMWDNTKTNSQREISNGVMKVPFTQLSLGYKFLDK